MRALQRPAKAAKKKNKEKKLETVYRSCKDDPGLNGKAEDFHP